MKRLLQAARSNPDIPIIWTQVSYDEMSQAGLFGLKAQVLEVFKKGDERELGDWIDEELEPREGEVVVRKKFASAFFGTGLDGILREMGVDTLVVCGVSTSGCVRGSCADGLCYGFRA